MDVGMSTRGPGVAGAQATASTNKPLEFDIEQSRNVGAIESLDQMLGALHNRLQPVLRQEEPSGPENGKEPEPVTMIGRSFRTSSQRIEAMSRAIGNILTRLEI